jgi:hypothetical protein
MKHFFRLMFQHARSRLQTKLGRATIIVVIVGTVGVIFPSPRVVAAAIVIGAAAAWLQMNASVKTGVPQVPLDTQRPEVGKSPEAQGGNAHLTGSSDAAEVPFKEEKPT